MPFHQRTVEPARLRGSGAAAGADAPLFRSLEQVSSHTLVCLLAQLADLSRCAGDVFGQLEGQAAALGRRTAALHRRLDTLHAAAARLDHRRVKIREWPAGRGRGSRREAPGELLPPAPWRPRAGSRAAARSSPRRASVSGSRVGHPGPHRAGGRSVRRSLTLGSGRFLAASMQWARRVGIGLPRPTARSFPLCVCGRLRGDPGAP